MRDPGRPLRATYRLQIHKGFTLDDARAIVPYLRRLGISHIYSSPLLAARPGSIHGYDVVDPTRVNPEAGGAPAFEAFVDALHAEEMGLVLDIVPNHMGTGRFNPYWESVLAHGPESRWAHWFDIDWEGGEGVDGPRVVLPLLGDELEKVLERGELRVERDADSGHFRLRYFDDSFPLSPETVDSIADENGDEPRGRARIRELLGRQHYRLTFWRNAPDEINYRRFFDVNDLVALRMEDHTVFEETHARVLEWVADGSLDGLRIDHIDGLARPQAYLDRLRAEVTARRGPDFPIVVEKILAAGELLPASWPVQGTTGYETLADIDDLFLEPAGFAAIEHQYRRMLRARGGAPSFGDVAIEGKRRVLQGALRPDVARLVRLLEPIAARQEVLVPHAGASLPAAGGVGGSHSAAGDDHGLDRDAVAAGVVELIACLPVYRTYLDRDTPPSPEALKQLDRAFARARERGVARADVLDLLDAVLRSGDPPTDAVEAEARWRFIHRFQQTSGPAAAKGVEDTALYTYMPLVSRNEVGGAPDRPLDDAVDRFHDGNRERADRWPLSLVCTNTHDTKRSADVRARLAALSEMPGAWWAGVRRWRMLNRSHRVMLGRRAAPDPNTEYLLYQVLLGIWPVTSAPDQVPGTETMRSIHQRIESYIVKAGKEGKSRTSWVDPVSEFEEATKRFVHAILFRSPDFVADFARFASTVAHPGMWTSISRIALQLTVPGTPDIYQGDELWNLALVDPDNRKPVAYGERARIQGSIAGQPLSAEVLSHPVDGRIKLHVINALLRARRDHPALFAAGDYRALEAEGAKAAHVIAFVRTHAGGSLLVVVPRFTTRVTGGGEPPVGRALWADTTVRLPGPAAGLRWRSVLDSRVVGPAASVNVADVCAELPVAVLVGE